MDGQYLRNRRARKSRAADFAFTVADFITGDLAASVVTKLTPTLTGLELSVGVERKRPVDERIARLDDARAALSEGLDAIDELRQDATRAKAEHAGVVSALETALANRDDAEKKLEAVRGIISQDVNAFREVAGVSDIRKERLIGFASGVCASIIASAIWTWGPSAAHWIGGLW
jgi:hypothetical protein